MFHNVLLLQKLPVFYIYSSLKVKHWPCNSEKHMLPSDTSLNNECAVEVLIPLKHLKLLPLSSNAFDADFLTEVALVL